jgi:hypothetical protein
MAASTLVVKGDVKLKLGGEAVLSLLLTNASDYFT